MPGIEIGLGDGRVGAVPGEEPCVVLRSVKGCATVLMGQVCGPEHGVAQPRFELRV